MNSLRIGQAIAGLAMLMLAVTARTQQPRNPPKFSPPGRMVDVGGYRLHIHCTGRGKPAVILEAGGGDFSLDWGLVQPRVAGFTRVCTYDRAGYGWSDAGPTPRTMRQIVSELRTGVRKARVKGPYVFVGHSFGGLLARVYAGQYPQEVVGMVLVDSAHEDMQILMNNKLTLLRELTRGREIPPIQTRIASPPPAASEGSRNAPAAASKLEPPYDKLPQDSQQIRLWAMSQAKFSEARRSEFDFLAEELSLVHADRAKQEFPLGDLPLIVLTRGRNLSEGHRRLQADLVRLSRHSKQVVAQNSAHHVHLDEPETVADAVRQVVNAVRQGRTLK